MSLGYALCTGSLVWAPSTCNIVFHLRKPIKFVLIHVFSAEATNYAPFKCREQRSSLCAKPELKIFNAAHVTSCVFTQSIVSEKFIAANAVNNACLRDATGSKTGKTFTGNTTPNGSVISFTRYTSQPALLHSAERRHLNESNFGRRLTKLNSRKKKNY